MPRTVTEYIVDSKGRKKAVVLPVKEFDRLMEHLEELEDALALDEAVGKAEEFTDYRQIREELKQEGRL
ncbi:MAG TPA: type II toxin-antitoxin system prevent-host-death family antitoxin [Dehalococcoidia bacterium]|nr:type II toxin-antitoxin system prevent-host-death family antitoxin [Dehalococcoidia bacterium]